MADRRPPRRGGHPSSSSSSSSRGPRRQGPGGPGRPARGPGRPPSIASGKGEGQGQGSGPGQGRAQGQRRPQGQGSRPVPQGRGPAAKAGGSSGGDRLQKALAHAGVGSRRSCEELILQGRVTVDGKVVRQLGTRVEPARQKIAVDGQPIHAERPVYFAVSKPKGYVSTNNDPSGRPRVVDLLPEIPQRVYTVGRLDEMSVGLMILTNDGELANKLAHPRFGVEKLYRVVVAGSPAREVLDKLVEGIWLAEGKVRAKRVRPVGKRGDSTILEMVLAEGKNREVRRMLAQLGHKVMTLARVAIGPVTLKGLKPGEYRPLSSHEVDLLRKVAAGIPVASPRLGGRSSDRPARPAGPRSGAPQSRPRPYSQSSGGTSDGLGPRRPIQDRDAARRPGGRPSGPPPRPRSGAPTEGPPQGSRSGGPTGGPPPRYPSGGSAPRLRSGGPPQRPRSGAPTEGPPQGSRSGGPTGGPPPRYPSGGSAPRSRSGGPPQRPRSGGPTGGPPPRSRQGGPTNLPPRPPLGPPPSQRKPAPPPPSRGEPPARRVIGLDVSQGEGPPSGSRSRRPPPPRRSASVPPPGRKVPRPRPLPPRNRRPASGDDAGGSE